KRDDESLDLLDYGFSQYTTRHPVRSGQVMAKPSIHYSGGKLPLRAAHPIAVGIRRGQRLQTSVQAPDRVTGPVRRGRPLGTGIVLVDGRVAGASALLAARSIPKASTFEVIRSRALSYLALIAGVALAILLVVLVVR